MVSFHSNFLLHVLHTFCFSFFKTKAHLAYTYAYALFIAKTFDFVAFLVTHEHEFVFFKTFCYIVMNWTAECTRVQSGILIITLLGY